MFARSILASSALLISFTASAAPQWAMLEGDIGDHTFLDNTSIAKAGTFVQVDVLRNYNETITLGNDPVTGGEMYPHRSVKLKYQVDCGTGTNAMTGSKLFEGNFGNGEVVWADRMWGKQSFSAAGDDETRAVVRSTCGTKTALR